MKYQVWTKGDEYSGWKKKDCPDLKAVMAEVLVSVKAGFEPLVTQQFPYTVEIKLKEVSDEVTEDKAQPDQGAGGTGDGEVRRGDETTP